MLNNNGDITLPCFTPFDTEKECKIWNMDPKCSNFIIHFINDDFTIDLRTASARVFS